MEQIDKTEIMQSMTPEALYGAIEKCLATTENIRRESAYKEARNALIRFRKVYSKLPPLPDHRENAIAGLQEIMDWCVRAIDIVNDMVDEMDGDIIEGFILKLDKLKGLPASGFPRIHKDIWSKAEDRAQKICDKYQTGKKRPRGLATFNYCSRRTRFFYTASIVSSLADVADRKAGRPNRWPRPVARNSFTINQFNKQMEDAFVERDFYRAVEKIYRLLDLDYTAALATLEEGIVVVFEEWNTSNATDTGDLLDKYDELKGLKLQDRVDKLARVYSIDSIVDTELFGWNIDLVFGGETRETLVDDVIKTLQDISNKIKEKSQTKQPKNKEHSVGEILKMPVRSNKNIWEVIKSEYDINKQDFGKKINFVSDPFKRKIIFRDVEHAFVLASQDFSKSAVILAGGVIEELLRLYLEHKNVKPNSKNFDGYIKACENNGLLKRGVSRLSDSIRNFRNLVHLENEKAKRHTVSKATAKGAVASIFTIANDFQ